MTTDPEPETTMTRRTKLCLEALELRENPASVETWVIDGYLGILSKDEGDILRVEPAGWGNSGLQVQRFANGQWHNIDSVRYGISVIMYTGNGGDDQFYNLT